jgi:hypothetical protein
MRIKPTPSRRNVVIDIETVSLDPNDPKGALSALTGRVVCICLLIDDGTQMREVTIIGKNETGMLRNFWAHVHPGDVFVGHNAWGYELALLFMPSLWWHRTKNGLALMGMLKQIGVMPGQARKAA